MLLGEREMRRTGAGSGEAVGAEKDGKEKYGQTNVSKGSGYSQVPQQCFQFFSQVLAQCAVQAEGAGLT